MLRYAISDIHGNAYAFLKLLDYVDPDPSELIILGDLCDRGFQTVEVFQEAAMLLDEGATIVKGNHDSYLEHFLTTQSKAYLDKLIQADIGFFETYKSIEHHVEKGNKDIPLMLMDVLSQMVMYHETDDYIFVHAGIDPTIPYMENQKSEVLMTSCKAWKNPKLKHTFDQTIIFGHTPTYRLHKEITEDDARVWGSRKANKIGIDTGAGMGCRLTMIDLLEGIAYAYDFEKADIIEYRYRRKGNWS